VSGAMMASKLANSVLFSTTPSSSSFASLIHFGYRKPMSLLPALACPFNLPYRNTPFDVSKFPGAGSLRICTAGRFTLKTPKPVNFVLLNTHLDDQSDDQRRLGASLILQRARFEAFNSSGPVLVTGDFNSPSIGPDSGAYNISTGILPPVPINQTFAEKFAVPNGTLDNFVLQDLKGKTPRFDVGGDFATFTGFVNPGDTSQYSRIDFVFGGSNGKWYVAVSCVLVTQLRSGHRSADKYKVETSLTDDGIQASDHRPVFADISI
jgi:endonuclease/exonuclease/phosphatase family metal-dependent hydrolase